MSHPHLSLRARFIGFILVLLMVMFSVIAGILLRTNTTSLRDNLSARSKAFAALATTPIGNTYLTYRDSGTLLISQQVTHFTELDSNIVAIAVSDTTGKLVYNPGNTRPITAAQAETFEPLYIYDSNQIIKRIVYPFIETDGRHRYAIVYDISGNAVQQAILRQVRAIILYSLVGLILSAVITYLLVNQLFLKPIKRLRDQAILISSGYYNSEISEGRNDEIGDLARSVKQMAGSLRTDIEKLTEVDKLKSEFMMIASHNLRTPLTAISSYVDMAQGIATDKQLKEMLGSISASSKRLQTFAEDLLTISGIEAGQQTMQSDRIVLDDMLHGVAREFKVLSDEKKIELIDQIQLNHGEVFGSKVHLRGAVWNLLENALKFTQSGGKIYLEATQDEKYITIKVRDTGIGIETEEMGKLFTKFHRGTDTLKYNFDGTGVGLYVTKLVINQHKGTISAESEAGKGATFTIKLPLAPSASPADKAGAKLVQL
jgi:signal transduction histidine kinase